ncbi:MAG: hypothetical protein Q9191_002662 [Dirinaria sp. TL-2023a]
MSAELDIYDSSPKIRKKDKKEKDNITSLKKRKRSKHQDTTPRPPTKKHRSKLAKHDNATTDQVLQSLDSIEASPFVRQTSSLYLPLSPICQRYPLEGLCAEHISPLLLTYYPPLNGVILSYTNAKLSTEPPRCDLQEEGPVLARSVDEYAVSYVWLTADFFLFRPLRGCLIDGWINLQNEGIIGLVCWNYFNASIERKRLPKDWKWIPAGGHRPRIEKLKAPLESTNGSYADEEGMRQANGTGDAEGHFVDRRGKKVEGLFRFRVKDMNTSRSADREHGFLSIEGTTLSDSEETELREQEFIRLQGAGPRRPGRRRDPEHSLPATRVLWTVGSFPPYAATGASGIISQLLEQVNEVIPLESDDWGLEDYAVEVGGFECLHFSDLGQVLKEDDEVCIRPLQTSDLRFRRISGRHQITSDGRHLIDGVAFGRPFLRRAERPAVRIPPRKRRRITFDEPEEENDDTVENARQLVFLDDPDNADNAESSDEQGDEDYSIPGQEAKDLTEESANIQNDIEGLAAEDRQSSPQDVAASLNPPRRRSRRTSVLERGLGLSGSALLELTDDNGRPYPGSYDNPLLELYSQEDQEPLETSLGKRKRQGRKSSTASHMDSAAVDKDLRAIRRPIGRRESSTSLKSVRFEDETSTTPPTTLLDAEESEDTEDEDFEAPADTDDQMDESDKENAEPKDGEEVSSEVMSSDSDTSSTSSESDAENGKAPSIASRSSKSSSEADTDIDQSKTAAPKSKLTAKDHPSSGKSSQSIGTSSKDRKIPAKSAMNVTQPGQQTLPPGMDESQVPQHTWQDLTLSSRKSTDLFRQTEPERARLWLKRVLKADSQAELVQAVLWHAYKNQFLGSTTDDNKLLTATQLIQNTRDMFVGAKTAVVTTPEKKYVIKGVRPRKSRPKEGAVEQPQAMAPQAMAPPGEGKTKTRRRNERRKNAKKLKSSTRHEIHPKSSASAVSAKSDAASETLTSKPDDAARSVKADLDARRNVLLEAIASGGVDIDQNIPTTKDLAGPSQPDNAPSNQQQGLETSNIERISEDVDSHGPQGNTYGAASDQLLPESADTTAHWPETDSFPKPEKPRAKIDLASSRRLLFGALGLRTPKSKEEEKALQEKLMKDIKPLKQPQSDSAATQNVDAAPEEDDESWRDRIVLKAVECCHEGVELSNPPFPFVQRWDPQQRNGYNYRIARRKERTNKKRKRNQDQYYDDGTEQQGIERAAKQGKLAPSMHNFAMNEMAPEDQQMYDARPTSSDAYEGAANEQLIRESDEAAVNLQSQAILEKDLPSVPEDVTTCPTLTQETARSGTVIAFKKLDMSVETKWQPKISDYRTAIIDEALDDGTLHMTLALRDRPTSGTVYDEETGERLYHKFEMPGFQDENDHEHVGRLELSFMELIEPKIIQAGEPIQTVKAMELEGNSDPSAAQALPYQGVSTATNLPKGKIVGPEEAEGGEPSKSSEDNGLVAPVESTDDVDVEVLPEDHDSASIKYPELDHRLQDLDSTGNQQTHPARPSPDATYTALSERKLDSPKPSGASSAANDVRQDILDLLEDAGWRSSIGFPSDEPKASQPIPTEQNQSIEIHVRSSDPPSETSNENEKSQEDEQVETLPAEIPETLQQPNEIGDSVQLSAQIATPERYHSVRASEGGTSLYGESPRYESDRQSWHAQDAQETAPRPTGNSMSPPSVSPIHPQPPSSEPSAFPPISPPEVSKRQSKVRKNGTAAGRLNPPSESSKTRSKARKSGPQPNINGNQHSGSDGANSDDELPSLEKVFASQISTRQRPSFSSSQDPTFKDEETQSNLHDLPSQKPSQRSEKSHTSKRTGSSSINSPLPILSDDDDEDPTRGFVFSSQIPPGSQAVDLTLSSDLVEPSDSAYEGDSSLPNGPGWVRKLTRNQTDKKAGKGRHVELRKGGKVATVRQ